MQNYPTTVPQPGLEYSFSGYCYFNFSAFLKITVLILKQMWIGFFRLKRSVTASMAILIMLVSTASMAGPSMPSPAKTCANYSAALQILGSGGPELTARSGPAYLLWLDGHARLLIDAGPGTRLRFAESTGKFEDLDAIFLTHLHVDHANDLPALVKAGYFTDRTRRLDLLGPSRNSAMPDTRQWIASLFGNDGYRYLSGHLDKHNDHEGAEEFYLNGINIDAGNAVPHEVWRNRNLVVKAAAVSHGSIPALAYRIEGDGFAVAISGDTNGNGSSQVALESLAKNATLFVAHHAVPELAEGTAVRQLHMTPSRIAAIAAAATPAQLVLSHRMNRTIGKENETTTIIRKKYAGKLYFAEDLDCLPLN